MFDFRKVFVRGNSMAKMKYQHNTAATNASCRRARLTCFVYAIELQRHLRSLPNIVTLIFLETVVNWLSAA